MWSAWKDQKLRVSPLNQRQQGPLFGLVSKTCLLCGQCIYSLFKVLLFFFPLPRLTAFLTKYLDNFSSANKDPEIVQICILHISNQHTCPKIILNDSCRGYFYFHYILAKVVLCRNLICGSICIKPIIMSLHLCLSVTRPFTTLGHVSWLGIGNSRKFPLE